MTETIRECLQRLPEKQFSVLYWYYYSHYNQTKIGKRLGVSQQHTARLIQQALSTLRKLVTEEINAA